MKILRIDPRKPDKSLISLASNALKEGKILIYPTDTVYGIGCSPCSGRVKEIFQIKRRSLDRPLSIACSDMEMVKKYADLSPGEEDFIRENILNPYTFIVRKKSVVPDIVTSGKNTVGVRIPDQLVVKEIISIAATPIITTSANVSGEIPPADFGEIMQEVFSQVDLAIDSGRCKIGKPSKIIDLKNRRVLRDST